jgi:hypothetical protein
MLILFPANEKYYVRRLELTHPFGHRLESNLRKLPYRLGYPSFSWFLIAIATGVMDGGSALNLGQREEYYALYSTPRISSALTIDFPAQCRS